MQLRCPYNGVHGISVGVLLRGAHEPLSVYGVVVAPVGGRSHRHTGLEHSPALAHAHQRAESAVTPPPNADVEAIDIRECRQVDGRLHLVACLQFAEFQVSALLEFRATCARSPAVNTHDDESLFGEVLVVGTALSHRPYPPTVDHLLASRTAVLVHDDGVFPAGVEVVRFHHPSVERHTL